MQPLWKTIMKVPKNLKIEQSYDPAIVRFGIYIKKENSNLKRYIHSFSYCRTIYNSQDTETN